MGSSWNAHVTTFLVLSLSWLWSFGGSVRADDRLATLRQDAERVESATQTGGTGWRVVEEADRLWKLSPACLMPDTPELAHYLELAAEVFHQVFRYADEETVLLQSLSIRNTRHDAVPAAADRRLQLAEVRFRLGRVIECRGGRAAAVRHYDEALAVLPETGRERDLLYVSLLNAQAVNDGSTGDVASALSRYEMARRVIEALTPPDPHLLAQVRLNTGVELMKRGVLRRIHGDLDGSRLDLETAESFIHQSGQYYTGKVNHTPMEGAEYLQAVLTLNHHAIATGNNAKAEASLERMLDAFNNVLNGTLMGASYVQALARAKIALGKTADAEKLYRTALAIYEAHRGSHSVVHEIAILKSDLARLLVVIKPDGQNHLVAQTLAREAVQEGLQLVTKGFVHMTDRGRLAYLESVREMLGLYLTLDDSADTYELVLAWKGAATARTALDRATGSLLERRSAQEYASRAYSDWAKTNRPKTLNENEWKARGAQLKTLRDETEQALRNELSKDATTYPPPPTAAQVSEALPDDSVLVDFVVYNHARLTPEAGPLPVDPKRIALFVSRRNQPTVRLLLDKNQPDIQGLLEKWNASTDATDRNALLRELRTAIWSHVEPHTAGASRIYLAPDQFLWRIPFVALPGRTNRYLVQEAVFIHVFSGRHAFELCKGIGAYGILPHSGCQVVGDVRYSSPGRFALKDIPAGDQWVAKTVSDARDAFPKSHRQPLTRTGATADAVLRSFSDKVRDIRFLGHGPVALHVGGFAPPAPWEARVAQFGIPLSGSNQDDPARNWSATPDAERIAALDLRGVATFLWWGCELNQGSLKSGEGVIGLPRALHVAGCLAVLSSQWRVEDPVARNISGRVDKYHWQKGKSVAEALAHAQREVIEADELYERQPDLWAGWIMIGDAPSPRESSSSENTVALPRPEDVAQRVDPTSSRLLFVTSSLIALSIGVWVVRKRLKRR